MAASRSAHLAAVLALSFVTPFAMGAQGPRDNLDGRLLAAHNRERAELGLAPMRWNPELAASAKSWARHLALTSRFEHSPDDPKSEPEGENLWAGTAGYYQPESMVGLWIDEKDDFKPGIFPNNSRSGDIERVGHYTQLVWAQTEEVGCAVQRGRAEDVLVCRYKSAGNVVGKSPFARSTA